MDASSLSCARLMGWSCSWRLVDLDSRICCLGFSNSLARYGFSDNNLLCFLVLDTVRINDDFNAMSESSSLGFNADCSSKKSCDVVFGG